MIRGEVPAGTEIQGGEGEGGNTKGQCYDLYMKHSVPAAALHAQFVHIGCFILLLIFAGIQQTMLCVQTIIPASNV